MSVTSRQIIYCALRFKGYVADMDWQKWLSLIIVAATGLALLRGMLRRRQFSFQRNTHCGCSGGSAPSPRSSIVFRAHRGQRPEVLVKMR